MARVKFLHEEALENLDLETWLSEYVDLKTGGGSERRIGTCPECFADDYKLYVNVETRFWICYKCDWGRGKYDAVELMAAVSGRTPTDIRIELASMVVITPAGDLTTKLNDIFDLVGSADASFAIQEAPEVVVPGAANFNGLSMQPVYNYAIGRGLTPQQIQYLGLQPAFKVPTKPDPVTGTMREVKGPWLVFPVRIAGKPVAWQGRKLKKEDKLKYLSSEGIHDWLWPLDDTFFKVWRPGMPVVIVEGVFDALGLLRYGVPALCTFGKSISDKQVSLLHELFPDELILMWDADAKREIYRAADRLYTAFPKVSVVNTQHPTGKKIDAGDALKDPQVVPWLASTIQTRLNTRSQEFIQQKIDQKFKPETLPPGIRNLWAN